MKKIIFLIGVMAIMAACGTTSTKPTEEATEPAVEETVVDTAAIAAPDSTEIAMPDTTMAE